MDLPGDVDPVTDAITLPGNDLTTGQQVTYNVAPASIPPVVFSVDAISSNTIDLPGNGFTNGDTVVYDANGGTAIGGLTNGVPIRSYRPPPPALPSPR